MNLYSYSYSRIFLNENEAKFIINLNFATTFNNTPTFKIYFNSENNLRNIGSRSINILRNKFYWNFILVLLNNLFPVKINYT